MLLDKLSKYGVRGYFLKFLESYFSFRKQMVRFKDEVSDEMYLNIGVIQGSKLGPLFSTYYILMNSTNCVLVKKISYMQTIRAYCLWIVNCKD